MQSFFESRTKKNLIKINFQVSIQTTFFFVILLDTVGFTKYALIQGPLITDGWNRSKWTGPYVG